MDTAYWWGPMFSTSWIFPILCIIFMAAMIFMCLRRAGGCCMPMRHRPAQPRMDARETPRQILDRRLAAGELSAQEYEEMRRRVDS